jgi:hypothetical protein
MVFAGRTAVAVLYLGLARVAHRCSRTGAKRRSASSFVVKAHREAMHSYRDASAERHELLRAMMPPWREV